MRTLPQQSDLAIGFFMSLDPWMCLEVSTYSIDEDPYRRMYPNVFVWAEETEPAEGKCEGRYSPWIDHFLYYPC